jgi:hypothetical protein
VENFRIDRTHFEILSFEEADKKINDHSDMTWKDRLYLVQYLNGIAFGYAGKEAPVMDKTIFNYGKLSDGKHIIP